MILRNELQKRFVKTIGILSLLCLGLLAVRMIATRSLHFGFIPENLALAWANLIFVWLLIRRLPHSQWISWTNIGLTVLWLIFLPNSFYVITDLIHVTPTGQISQIYDFVLFCMLAFCGFIIGLTSLFLMHKELLKRMDHRRVYLLIEIIILLNSFAIYLGRNLRWNTWDVITNPSGIILNISDRILDPMGHKNSITLTALFFITISTVYLAFWIMFKPIKLPKP